MATRSVEMTVSFLAWDTAANAAKTGDSGNFTLRWIKDGTASAPTNSVSEVDATNAPGVYKLTLTSTETDANIGTLAGKSSTASVSLIPTTIQFERLPNAAPGAASGVSLTSAVTDVETKVDTVDSNVDAILLDTGTTIPATIATVDTVVDAVKAVTDNLPDSGALSSLATASALSTVDTVVDSILEDTGTTIPGTIATVDTVVDGIKAVTDNLPDSGALSSLATASALATVDGNVDSVLVDTGTTIPATIATVDTVVDGIKAVTDNLPDSGALSSLATASALATVDTNVDSVLVDTGTTIPATLTTIDGKVDTVDAVADGIKAVTDNLPDSGALSSLATASALATVDGNVDAVLVDTGTTLPATLSTIEGKVDTVDTVVDSISSTLSSGVTVASISDGAIGADAVADIWSTTALAESYASDGSTGTGAQLLYQIQQALTEFAISSTTLTVKKLDGSTTASTYTLDDASAPTSRTRAS